MRELLYFTRSIRKVRKRVRKLDDDAQHIALFFGREICIIIKKKSRRYAILLENDKEDRHLLRYFTIRSTMENTKRNLFHEEEESHVRGIFGVLRPLRRSNILFERSRVCEGRVCRAKSHNCIIIRMHARSSRARICTCAYVYLFRLETGKSI